VGFEKYRDTRVPVAREFAAERHFTVYAICEFGAGNTLDNDVHSVRSGSSWELNSTNSAPSAAAS
jgi:hypothetical protein